MHIGDREMKCLRVESVDLGLHESFERRQRAQSVMNHLQEGKGASRERVPASATQSGKHKHSSTFTLTFCFYMHSIQIYVLEICNLFPSALTIF